MKSSLVLKLGIGIILIIVTLFAFFGKEGTDNFVTENLYEALHPLKFNDILGLIIFYASALFLAGFKPQINPKNSSRWNYITFAGLVIGIFLIWL
jgi:MFS superfamily sulfate permease-like transporter